MRLKRYHGRVLARAVEREISDAIGLQVPHPYPD
jgi:hypothetical protein